MKLGIGSYACAWAAGIPGYPVRAPLTAFALLERAAALGVSVVQYADNLPLHTLSSEERERLRAIACEMGITIEVGTRGIALGNLRRYHDIACQLSSPIVRVVIDTAAHHPDYEEMLSTLRLLEPIFRSSGIVLAIENHDRFRASELRALIEELGSWAGVCLDTVNSFGALEGPEVVVNTLGPVTVNLHLKDFTIRRTNTQMGFIIEGCPAGQGRLDIPWLLCTLAKMGRDPNAILELWTPAAATLEETIAKERCWAEESIHFLRTLVSQ